MCKNTILITLNSLLLCLACESLQAQKVQQYYFDEQMQTTSRRKAVITGEGVRTSEGFNLKIFSTPKKQLLLDAFFTDSTFKTYNGRYSTYFENGAIKERGIYSNNKKIGWWQQGDEQRNKLDSLNYNESGLVVVRKKWVYTQDGLPYYFSEEDSLRSTFVVKYLNVKTKLATIHASFIGNKGVMLEYDSTGKLKSRDSVFTREDKEAEFKGGAKGWREYLVHNLDALVPVNNRARPGIYTAMVKFIIQPDGKVTDVTLEKDPGYGMGEEAMRLIKISPDWEPGVRFGKKVSAYRIQPISFQVMGE